MVLLFAAFALIVAWGSVAAVLGLKRRDALQAQDQQGRNLARVLSEQTLRVLAAADQAMLRVVQDHGAAQLRPEDLIRFANETGLAPLILVQLSLVDAQGVLVGSNLDPSGRKNGRIDLSDREHVKAHLGQPDRPADQDRLFVGRPVLGKVSNRWTIQLSRALRDANGHIDGVIVASLDPSYFERVYADVDVGQTGSVALIGQDMNVRARVIGGKPDGMGRQLPPGSALGQHLGEPEGNYRSTSSLDGVRRIYAFRHVAGLPLLTLVSIGEEEALRDWRATRDGMIGLTAVLSLAIVASAVLFVTGLRRLEQSHDALKISEAEALAANQAKSEFLAAISHELRTPLTSIRGYAELMEQRLQEPRYREAAGLIRKGAEHLNKLLTEILDLAKVEAGSMQLSPEPVDLQQLLNGTADFFALSAQSKGLTLTQEFDPALPPAILCDGLRLKQILNNLLSNAIKFTEQGGVRLRMARDGDSLLVQVIDTGPGIPAEKHAQIFEKFRQGDASVSYQHGGTGLGLALSRALAELMHGQLGIEPSVGTGACFSLRLPLLLP
ncbi:sensor histidine kinase [Pelomonas saccharophila]|uniref:Virulence sensor protein BvgS n=2 Tax=Roseateles saccharophilus TaxID=304 RepID=A0A4R3UJS5_ROSSA|nr:sensor histidine kinase [Roseateles saccharophilus]TCU89862.1 signal transduction histidine kinase [Roseateles saccharophilus]